MTFTLGSPTVAPTCQPSSAGLLWRARQAITRAIASRQTRRELSRLSDRTLQDIGLRRGEIDSIAQAVAEARRDATRMAPRLNDPCL